MIIASDNQSFLSDEHVCNTRTRACPLKKVLLMGRNILMMNGFQVLWQKETFCKQKLIPCGSGQDNITDTLARGITFACMNTVRIIYSCLIQS